jgi:hypothetical protein
VDEEGEKDEHFTRRSLDTSVWSEDSQGGRNSCRSAAAGTEFVNLGVDTELLRLACLPWQNEGVVAVRTVVAAWLKEARSGGASQRWPPWRARC